MNKKTNSVSACAGKLLYQRSIKEFDYKKKKKNQTKNK